VWASEDHEGVRLAGHQLVMHIRPGDMAFQRAEGTVSGSENEREMRGEQSTGGCHECREGIRVHEGVKGGGVPLGVQTWYVHEVNAIWLEV
jgi:hypothetical protein